ncbi:MAG: hypothetical protein MI802_02505 [Desulfobacterales bacterium]|nr:hypothetical protein [Desulfobacterales bacterium]
MGTVRRWGDAPASEENLQYFSAEFQLENPRIFFQFRLRYSDAESMFVVVKQDSQALECLKAGDVIPMTFHYQDRDIPAERQPVRITSISDGMHFGFKGHFVISLEPNPGEHLSEQASETSLSQPAH